MEKSEYQNQQIRGIKIEVGFVNSFIGFFIKLKRLYRKQVRSHPFFFEFSKRIDRKKLVVILVLLILIPTGIKYIQYLKSGIDISHASLYSLDGTLPKKQIKASEKNFSMILSLSGEKPDSQLSGKPTASFWNDNRTSKSLLPGGRTDSWKVERQKPDSNQSTSEESHSSLRSSGPPSEENFGKAYADEKPETRLDDWKDTQKIIKTEVFHAGFKNNPIAPNVQVNIKELDSDKYELSVYRSGDRVFRPGKYELVITLESRGAKRDIRQNFDWGVLALNTNKSIYSENETAKLFFGVLSETGHTICNAKLTLKIQSHPTQTTSHPALDAGSTQTKEMDSGSQAGITDKTDTLSTDNGKIKYTGACHGDNIIKEPDYQAEYKLGKAGFYQMTLTATTKNGEYTIEDFVEVRPNVIANNSSSSLRDHEVAKQSQSEIAASSSTNAQDPRNDNQGIPFDVERSGPTRINPKADYEMEITIKANQDFKGDIIEYVPYAYGIKNAGLSGIKASRPEPVEGEKVLENDEQKLIFKNVSLTKGQTKILKYTFDPSDISPELFLLGPLEFRDSTPHPNPSRVNPLPQGARETPSPLRGEGRDEGEKFSADQRTVPRNSALIFAEQRYWLLASDAVAAAGVIVAWDGTTSLPSGWSRVTNYDGYFVKATTSTITPTPTIVANHSHASAANHSHSSAHTHASATTAAQATGATDTGAGVSATALSHSHVVTISSNAAANNSSEALTFSNVDNNPTHTTVIFMKSNGTTAIPENAWAMKNDDSFTGWTRVNNNKFLKGAATDTGGGTSAGSDLTTHTHTASHSHTESAAHSHSATAAQSQNGQVRSDGSAELADITHTHALTITGVNPTATESNADAVTDVPSGTSGVDGNPPWYKLNIIDNTSGAAETPDSIIAMWDESLGTIPSEWVLCDGLDACPDLNGKFIMGTNANSEFGTTGGASTHTHSGTAHSHTIDAHAHTWTIGSTSSVTAGIKLSGASAAPVSHDHGGSVSVSSTGVTGEATVATGANASNEPSHVPINFIEYHEPVTILNQNHYRWRDDLSALTDNTGWLAAEDTGIATGSGTLRLRIEIANTGTSASESNQYRLEYAKMGGGSCGGGDEIFTAVPATSTTEHFEMVTSNQYADDASITSGFLTATGSWGNGRAVEDPSNQNTTAITINASYYTEVEYAIAPTNYANRGSSYCFRVTNAGEGLTTYSAYPQLDVIEESKVLLNWKFDETTGTTASDSAVYYRNIGDIYGASWRTSDMCISGSCLEFDGTDDRVERAYASDKELDPWSDSFSVSAWVRHASAISGTDTIISRYNGAGYKVYMESDGDICFGIDDDASSFPEDSACSENVDYNDSKWHFVEAVKQNTSTIKLYIDGVERKSTAVTANGSLDGSSPTFYVGMDTGGASNPWDGFIDDVKVYKGARSALQAKSDYNSRGTVEGTSVQMGNPNLWKSLSDSLVGYWKEDETTLGASATDSSGNGQTLTDSGTVAFTSGKYDNAGDFENTNTDEFQYLADNAALSITGDLTVSAWIKPEIVSAGSRTIAAKWDLISGAQHESYKLLQNADELAFYIDAEANYVQTTAANLAAATWYHVTAVYNSRSQTARIYVNGELQTITTTGTIPASIGDDSSRFHIGGEDSQTAGAANEYDGLIDEIRIYNRAFSEKEVRDLYLYSFGDSSEPMIGHWKFDEGSGSTAFDSSGNGNDGSVTIGTGYAWSSSDCQDGNCMSTSDNATLDAVNMGDPVSGILDFSDTQDFTTEIWVKVNSMSDSYALFLNKGGVTGGMEGYTTQYNASDTSVRCFYEDTDSGNGTGDKVIVTYNIVDGAWHHLACVMDRTGTATGTAGYHLFIDGNLAGSLTTLVSGSAAVNAEPLYIGERSPSTEYNGKFDDVRIYDYARTASQIAQDMAAGDPAVDNSADPALGHWKFDEGVDNMCPGGTNDVCNAGSEGVTLDGTSTGLRINDGKFGRALGFDGSTRVVTIPNADAIDYGVGLKNGFTISAWINANNAGEGNAGMVYQKGATELTNYLRVDTLSGNNLDVEANVDLASADANVNVSAGITTGIWNHIAVSWKNDDDDEVSIYINGVLRGTSTAGSGDPTDEASSLLIGGSTSYNFNGKIDEFKVYNYSLTSDEIKLDYNQGKSIVFGALSDTSGLTSGSVASNSASAQYCIPGDTSTCKGPVGEWKFEEGSGSNTYDTSGNGKNATLNADARRYPAKVGKGITLDGTGDYIDPTGINGFGTYIGNASYTVSLWAYTRQANTRQAIFADWDSGGASQSFAIEFGSFFLGNTNITTLRQANSVVTSLDSNVTYAANTWYHITVTENTVTRERVFYINGKRTNSDTVDSNNIQAGAKLTFGRGGAYDGLYLNGAVDHIRVYNYARTPAQVARDYNKGKPLVYYKFNECSGSTLNESMGSTMSATLNLGSGGTTTIGTCTTSSSAWGGASGSNSGKYNYAMNFDGTDDRAQTTHIPILAGNSQTTTKASWGAWVKPTSSAASKTILHKGNEFRLTTDSNSKAVCAIYSGSWKTSTAATSNSALSLDSWSHVLCTYDGANVKIYVNGNLSGTGSSETGNITSIYTALNIGRDSAGSGYFQGMIDEVKVYNYDLTASLVRNDYNQGAGIRFGP